MKGWQIFLHSLRMVGRNWRQAAQIVLGTAAMLIVMWGLTFVWLQDMPGAVGDPSALAALLGLAAILGSVALLINVVVRWHRFVLLEETPPGWLPRILWGRVMAYLWQFLLLGLVLGLAIIPMALAVSILASIAGAAGLVLGGAAMALSIGVMFYRLSPVLPGAATGQPIGLRGAWRATAGDTGAFVGLVIVLGLANLAVQAVLAVPGSSAVHLLIVSVLNLAWVMVGLSVVTTVYGHYVEGRGIN